MTDPAKNSEIEDVLSSIRRLVSENHDDSSFEQAMREAAAKPTEPMEANVEAAADARPDRLVLSPALRVEETTSDVELIESKTSPVADTDFVHSLKEDILPLRDSLPSFLQRRLDDAPEDPVDEEVSEAPVEIGVDEDVIEEPAENTVPFPAPEELIFETARAVAVEAVEPSVEAQDGESDLRPWETEGQRLSEWHSVRRSGPEGFEPDGPEDGENAGTPVAALNWEDHEAETEAVAAPSAPAVEIEEAPAADPVSDQITETVMESVAAEDDTLDAQQYDAVLDEEMLRELVGEIVRQELQGPLGERITRNVRKLVRREINRALTARSFNDG